MHRAPSLASGLVTLAPLLLSMVLPACSPPSYPRATLPRFRARAPRAVAFEALVRRAGQLGYVHANVDPESTSFAVHAHMFGARRRRRARRPSRRPSRRRIEVIRDDLLIVEVGDDVVLVRAFGPHVLGEDHVHPDLAEEMRVFALALRETTLALTTGGLAAIVGTPPGAFGRPPSAEPERASPQRPGAAPATAAVETPTGTVPPPPETGAAPPPPTPASALAAP